MPRLVKRFLVFGMVAAVILVATAVFVARAILVASLPDERGTRTLVGLSAEVTVDRDAMGVPTIRASSLQDAVRALGFVHAQERFFQMDGMRRFASGRVAEILGARGLDIDRRMRPFRFSQRVEEAFKTLPAEHRGLLTAYADGVNAGLAELDAAPPEYLLLGTTPEAWHPSDTLLVECFMFSTLSMGADAELTRDALYTSLPGPLAAFLTPDTSRWDAPLIPDGHTLTALEVPGPEVVALRGASAAGGGATAAPAAGPPGSNCWVVAGSRTVDGRAILADDMHLGLMAPPPWFRAELHWGDRRAIGATLAGVPGIVAGSTDRVAWGFTNACGDFEDYVVVETLPDDAGRYRTPDGAETFSTIVEEIGVKGQAAERFEIRVTRWGAVTQSDATGRPLVLKWIALEPGALNVAILDMLDAADVDEAMDVARAWRGPPQNVLAADTTGRIAWTVSGWIPRRRGFDGTRPVSWATRGIGWEGPIDEKDRPMVVDPPEGILYTANNRTLPLERARGIGANWTSSYRANRIAQRLRERPALSERDLFDIQLDTRAEPGEFYRNLVLECVPADAADAAVRRARAHVKAWNGRADADQPGYRILRSYVRRLDSAVLGTLLKPVSDRKPGFRYQWFLRDEPLRRVLEERPAHLLPSGDSWTAFLRSEFERAVDEIESAPNSVGGVDTTWGQANRSRVRHVMSAGLGPLARFVDMPVVPQDGDTLTVRVASATFGASERLVVSPGHWDDGLFQMPAGQSGHPMSRHYSDGHAQWVHGTPSPLRPGPTTARLRLVPAGQP